MSCMCMYVGSCSSKYLIDKYRRENKQLVHIYFIIIMIAVVDLREHKSHYQVLITTRLRHI